MLKIVVNAFILFSFISPCLMTGGGRKYDVESEAMKLYGEDFKSVLRRFRRTPDYLKILTDKMDDLKVYVREMSAQVLNYIHSKMVQRVNDLVGVTRPFEDATSPAPGANMYYHSYNRRQDAEGEAGEGEVPPPGEEPDQLEPEDPVEGGEEDVQHMKDVKTLDNYKAFNALLTTQERNSFRDVGYEFAGQLIHAIITNMGPVVEPQPKSTKLPNGGDPEKFDKGSTTEHPQTHEVTAASTAGETHEPLPPEGEEATTPETYRFRGESNWKRIEKFFSKWS
ncbi:uncharacterized protein LOC110378964 isoform X1 [Helicoverpa armigera]|uniref:uncharacterized protein LOC110378964 isoform X1 n=1 Tax=Helicoverpa armigera TaxID=29058 RepID=UPI003083285A